jgi:hypothetical protein
MGHLVLPENSGKLGYELLTWFAFLIPAFLKYPSILLLLLLWSITASKIDGNSSALLAQVAVILTLHVIHLCLAPSELLPYWILTKTILRTDGNRRACMLWRFYVAATCLQIPTTIASAALLNNDTSLPLSIILCLVAAFDLYLAIEIRLRLKPLFRGPLSVRSIRHDQFELVFHPGRATD